MLEINQLRNDLLVKRYVRRSNRWDPIALYDLNNNFRGEARFETKRLAENYIKLYKDRINKHLNAEGKSKTSLKLRVFDESDSKAVKEINDRKYGLGHHLNALS